MPSPTFGSSTPTSVSARTASRSELRESPRRDASTASLGSLAPAVNSPETIRSLIFAIAWSVRGAAIGNENNRLLDERRASLAGKEHVPSTETTRAAACGS